MGKRFDAVVDMANSSQMDIEEDMKRPRTTTPSCTLTVPDLKEAKVNVLGDCPVCYNKGVSCLVGHHPNPQTPSTPSSVYPCAECVTPRRIDGREDNERDTMVFRISWHVGGRCHVACAKLVRQETVVFDDFPVLKNEVLVMQTLQGALCVPILLHAGPTQVGSARYNMMVHNVVGDPLDKLPSSIHHNSELHTQWAYALTQGLKDIHNRGVIHRDIKPSNIVWTCHAEVFFIDFGLSLDTSLGFDPFIRYFVGTPSFSSASVRNGARHTFADDWESLFFTFAFLRDPTSIRWPRSQRLELARTLCDDKDVWSIIPLEGISRSPFPFSSHSQSVSVERRKTVSCERHHKRRAARTSRATKRKKCECKEITILEP